MQPKTASLLLLLFLIIPQFGYAAPAGEPVNLDERLMKKFLPAKIYEKRMENRKKLNAMTAEERQQYLKETEQELINNYAPGNTQPVLPEPTFHKDKKRIQKALKKRRREAKKRRKESEYQFNDNDILQPAY